MNIKNKGSKIAKISVLCLSVLLLFFITNMVYAEELYLGDDDEVYVVNTDDSQYIQNLEKELEEKENLLSKQDSKIEQLEYSLNINEKNYNNEKQNMWFGFGFTLLLAIYISYSIGSNKK